MATEKLLYFGRKIGDSIPSVKTCAVSVGVDSGRE